MAKEEDPSDTLAARRARLRSSLTTQAISIEQQSTSQAPASTESDNTAPPRAVPTVTSNTPIKDYGDTQALELLGNIDQALSSCATHLASLQKVASKQIDELKVIANTLQSHSAYEAGLNVNTLMESLTAAIEPMKAIGELVPALDRLVNVSALKNEQPAARSSLTEKQLVSSLAEQLVSGAIDASTFKSACQAVFPNYDLNGLLHQLSELLSEQQLSGELFQFAFKALQSEPDKISSPLEQPTSLEPMHSRREVELEKQLADQENEFEKFREQLDERWQDMNKTCEELRGTLQNRENILQSREAELNEKIEELAAKDSENQQLRAQMEELRDQTKAMVTDLQKQLAQKQAEEKATRTAKTKPAAPQPGFFELFTNNQPRPDSSGESSSEVEAGIATPGEPVQPNTATKPTAGAQPVSGAPATPAAPAATPAGFASPAASFVSAAGSYGSGVRAQVFEVIVRQALAGAHWREICAVPMQINNILPEEVEAEVKRRQALLKK